MRRALSPPRLVDAPDDVIKEQALSIDAGTVDTPFGVLRPIASAASIHADYLVIAPMHHQQAVRPAGNDLEICAIVAFDLVLVPVEEAQVKRLGYKLILALKYGWPVDIVLGVLVVRFPQTFLQINKTRDLKALFRAHYQKDNGLQNIVIP